MAVRWTTAALSDLDEAHDYIAEDDELAADSVAQRLTDAVSYLEDHPTLGRAGRLRGTRELVVSGTPFIVVYRVRSDELQVLRVLHHSRRWPR